MSSDLQVEFITPINPEFLEAKRLRYAVLYEPLGIAESDVEWCDTEHGTSHAVVFSRGRMAGYGRVVVRGAEAQIRHLAVLPQFRGKGVGTALLDGLVERARLYGASSVYLNARFTALGMYRAKGFGAVGPIFHTESTHLPHQRMELTLV